MTAHARGDLVNGSPGHSERLSCSGDDRPVPQGPAIRSTPGYVILCVGETRTSASAGTRSSSCPSVRRSREVPVERLADVVTPVQRLGDRHRLVANPSRRRRRAASPVAVRSFDKPAIERVLVLYGGSLSPTRPNLLLGLPDVDGAWWGARPIPPLAEIVEIPRSFGRRDSRPFVRLSGDLDGWGWRSRVGHAVDSRTPVFERCAEHPTAPDRDGERRPSPANWHRRSASDLGACAIVRGPRPYRRGGPGGSLGRTNLSRSPPGAYACTLVPGLRRGSTILDRHLQGPVEMGARGIEDLVIWCTRPRYGPTGGSSYLARCRADAKSRKVRSASVSDATSRWTAQAWDPLQPRTPAVPAPATRVPVGACLPRGSYDRDETDDFHRSRAVSRRASFRATRAGLQLPPAGCASSRGAGRPVLRDARGCAAPVELPTSPSTGGLALSVSSRASSSITIAADRRGPSTAARRESEKYPPVPPLQRGEEPVSGGGAPARAVARDVPRTTSSPR